MPAPLVTVIIPVYNVEKYLDRCLNSVVSQTYRNLEIILVDDGSLDQCPKMCDEWRAKDSRISVIHKSNAGLGMARNTGLDYASGEFVFFFDSDDYIALDTVDKCVRMAQSTMSDTVLFGRNEVYTDGTIEKSEIKIPKAVFESEEIVNVLLPGLYTYSFGYGVSVWSKMFSMKIIRSCNLKFKSEREIISEDAFFCLEYFSQCSKVSLIEDNLYYYFKNENSLSRSYRHDRQLRNDDFLLKSIERINELTLPYVVQIHLKSRYQVFSIAAMKHIISSNMPAEAKKNELLKIYQSEVLRGTIDIDVLRVSSFTIAVFMFLIKMRCYILCNFLLKYKLN